MTGIPPFNWYDALLHPQEESGKRRLALLQAAFDVVAEVGFEGLRTRAVAQRAKVNIATLHYYFPTKQSLVEGLAQFIGARFVVLHGPAPVPSGYPALDRLRQEFSDGRYYLEHQPKMLIVMAEFVLRGKRDPEVQKVVEVMNGHWRRGLEQMVIDGINQGPFRAELDPKQTIPTLMAVFSGVGAAQPEELEAIQHSVEDWLLQDGIAKTMSGANHE
ncbi:MAG TPA: TetR/AcrR family transcriptional regulator [Acidobacteriaceae bacterium]